MLQKKRLSELMPPIENYEIEDLGNVKNQMPRSKRFFNDILKIIVDRGWLEEQSIGKFRFQYDNLPVTSAVSTPSSNDNNKDDDDHRDGQDENDGDDSEDDDDSDGVVDIWYIWEDCSNYIYGRLTNDTLYSKHFDIYTLLT